MGATTKLPISAYTMGIMSTSVQPVDDTAQAGVQTLEDQMSVVVSALAATEAGPFAHSMLVRPE